MYERLLEKNILYSKQNLSEYCAENSARFEELNRYLTGEHGTEESIRFPYGNKYGWCVTHRKKKKLICDIFAESGAFTLMLRLPNATFASVYESLHSEARECVDNRYPCSDGGWIHFRILNDNDLADAKLHVSKKIANSNL